MTGFILCVYVALSYPLMAIILSSLDKNGWGDEDCLGAAVSLIASPLVLPIALLCCSVSWLALTFVVGEN